MNELPDAHYACLKALMGHLDKCVATGATSPLFGSLADLELCRPQNTAKRLCEFDEHLKSSYCVRTDVVQAPAGRRGECTGRHELAVQVHRDDPNTLRSVSWLFIPLFRVTTECKANKPYSRTRIFVPNEEEQSEA